MPKKSSEPSQPAAEDPKIQEEELDVGNEDEDQTTEDTDADTEVDDDESLDDEGEEESTVEAQPSRRGRGDERIAEVTSRMARLEGVLNQLTQHIQGQGQGQGQQAGRQPASAGAVDDADLANLNPNQREWAKFVRAQAQPVIQRTIDQFLTPIQAQQRQVAAMVDRTEARRQFRDFDRYATNIDGMVAQIYQQYGIVPPYEFVYHVVKGREQLKRAPAEATNRARKAAKPGATQVPSKSVAKKPGGPSKLTHDKIQGMSLEELEKIALDLVP